MFSVKITTFISKALKMYLQERILHFYCVTEIIVNVILVFQLKCPLSGAFLRILYVNYKIQHLSITIVINWILSTNIIVPTIPATPAVTSLPTDRPSSGKLYITTVV